jgi:hypothetical protein
MVAQAQVGQLAWAQSVTILHHLAAVALDDAVSASADCSIAMMRVALG